MSHLSNQLHHDARKRFDDLGLSLLSRITTFRATPAQARPDFSPDVFKDEPFTDANNAIVGDVHLKWKDSYGKLTGIAVTRFAEEHNHRRYHESLQNVTPADVRMSGRPITHTLRHPPHPNARGRCEGVVRVL